MQMNPKRLGFFAAIPGRNIDETAVPTLARRTKDRVAGTTTNSTGPADKIVGKSTEGKSVKTPNGVYTELKHLYYECAHAA